MKQVVVQNLYSLIQRLITYFFLTTTTLNHFDGPSRDIEQYSLTTNNCLTTKESTAFCTIRIL